MSFEVKMERQIAGSFNLQLPHKEGGSGRIPHLIKFHGTVISTQADKSSQAITEFSTPGLVALYAVFLETSFASSRQ